MCIDTIDSREPTATSFVGRHRFAEVSNIKLPLNTLTAYSTIDLHLSVIWSEFISSGDDTETVLKSSVLEDNGDCGITVVQMPSGGRKSPAETFRHSVSLTLLPLS
jgi:hypothetical protein